MKRPTITMAKRIVLEHGAIHGMVILFGADGRISGVSYGDTRESCAHVGQTLDAIIEALERGALPSP